MRLPFDPLKTVASQSARKTSTTPPADPAYGAPVRSVKQTNALVSQTLASHLPATFAVAGELSNFRTYDRGHAFFTLKEPGAEIPCIIWRDSLLKLPFTPKDGQAVIARGQIKMYEPQGKIQLYVDALFPRGTGGLELAFRQLCDKLKAEGLFETARKKPIPRLPQHVAIITSRTGDVLHDVLTTALRRFPGLHIMLLPVPVQGPTAAAAIVNAIQLLNSHFTSLSTHHSSLDLILLVRGGGSLEDLQPFNDESVARAIVASRIPIATGIGHEPDTTIADLVGDLRGPTPTGITELTIPDAAVLRAQLDSRAALLTRDMQKTLDASRADIHTLSLELTAALRTRFRDRSATLEPLSRAIARIEPRHAIAQGWRRAEDAQRRLDLAARRRVALANARLAALQSRLEKASPHLRLQRSADKLTHLSASLRAAADARLALSATRLSALQNQLRLVSPQTILDRGYSITTLPTGQILRSAADARTGDVLTTQLADGKIRSTVGEPRQARLF